MFRHDGAFWWKPGHIYIPYWAMTAWEESSGTTQAAGAGNPLIQEVGSTGVVGSIIGAAGDEWHHMMMLPDDLDIKRPMYFRVIWSTASTTDTDTITFLLRYKAIELNSDTIASPSTAIDTQFGADTHSTGTADTVMATDWGKLDGNTFTKLDTFVIWELEADAADMTLGSEDTFMHGLEIRYTPRRLVGPDGMRSEAKEGATMFSKTSTPV